MSRLSHRLTKRTIRWMAVLVIAVIIIAGVVIGYIVWSSHSVIERQIIREADFPVYAPRSEPDGFVVSREETRLGGGVLSYVLTNEATGKDITVTVQPRPSDFDMSQMTKGGSVESVVTQNGTIYNLSVAGSARFLLNTSDTLVFLTSSESVEIATVTVLVNSLVRFD